jgi:predicted CxxxxCH...CXXCH cytochrome family protein
MPESAIKDDYKIQMGFEAFSFKGNGSIYNAQELNSDYDYQGTNGTAIDSTAMGTVTSCENIYCHSDGTAVSTRFFDPTTFPGPSQTSPAWNGSTTCDSCHAYGPDYPHLSPKLNAHARHLSLFYSGGLNEDANPCHICHKTSTPDGINTNPEFHANGQYDVVPDGEFVFKVNQQPESQSPVSFDYKFDAGRSTCSNISCHQDGWFGENFSWGYGSVSASPHTMRSGDQCGEVEFGISVSGAYPLHSVALPVTYYIDWGDGSEPLQETVESSSSPIYSHIYADHSINYDVTWTVRDAKRLTLVSEDMHKTHTVTPYTGNAYPTVAFAVSVDGYTVTLTDQSYDLDYNTCGHEGPGRARIAWGDGSTEIYEFDLTDTPSGQQFSHTYPVRPYTRRISYAVYDNVINYPVFVYENVPVPQE